jgi:hypothetical protein
MRSVSDMIEEFINSGSVVTSIKLFRSPGILKKELAAPLGIR